MSSPRDRRLTPEHSGRQKPDSEPVSPMEDSSIPPPPMSAEPPRAERDRPPKAKRTPSYRGAQRLQDQVALITGADAGLGRAVAVLFAREGANLGLVYRDAHDDGEMTRQACINEGCDAISVAGDVTRGDFCKRAVDRAVKHFGRIDVLVNCATYRQPMADLEDLGVEQWERSFRTNVHACFYMIRAALPHLGEGSCIINTGSMIAVQGCGTLVDFGATQGAIHALTRSLALQLKPRGIRVNCVAPGPVWSPADSGMQPEAIAPSYVFLASPVDAASITGQIFTLPGA